jgi:hypothetical protein
MLTPFAQNYDSGVSSVVVAIQGLAKLSYSLAVQLMRAQGAEMDKQNKMSESDESAQAKERRLYFQFEIAKRLYAAHRLLVNAPPLDRQKIVVFLQQALADFQEIGGVAKTGTDVFGESGPVLYCENGDLVPYDAGRMLAEDYIAKGIFR